MELSSAGVVAETALDKLTQANEQLRVDIEKWHEAKNIQWSAVKSCIASDKPEET